MNKFLTREQILNARDVGPSLSQIEQLATEGDETAKNQIEEFKALGREIYERLQKMKEEAEKRNESIRRSLDIIKIKALPPAALDFLHNRVDLKIKDIADALSLKSQSQVSYWFKKYDIPIIRRGGDGLGIKDMTGEVFDRLTVVERDPRSKHGACWICKCQCGNTVSVKRTSLIKNLTKSCGCLKKELTFKGVGDLSLSYWSRIVRGAQKRGLLMEMSIEDAWRKYQDQDGKCAMSGLDINIVSDYTRDHGSHTASLDRVDHDLGYTVRNTQWVHRRLNMMRRTMSVEEFNYFCKKVTEHNESRSSERPRTD